jgi:hypothetical protein
MKTYIVYKIATEIAIIKAGSLNSAEKKAKAKYGNYVHCVYTEI